ncbi:MAG: hypothetical protein V1778_00865 [bacterium]
MKPRDEVLKNLIEKEIHKFYIVQSQTNYCSECGRATLRPKICQRCLERKARVDLRRRSAMVSQ